MTTTEPNYIMIRAMGQTESEFDVFFKNNIVAVGWSNIDFSSFHKPEDLEDLIARIVEEYYSNSDIAPQQAGIKRNEVRRFMGIRPGDRIVVPHYDSVCLATASKELIHDSTQKERGSHDLGNQRRVEYLVNLELPNPIRLEIPRTELSTKLQTRLRVQGSSVRNLNEFATELAPYWDASEHHGLPTKIRQMEISAIKEFKNNLLKNIRSGNINLKAGGIGLEHLVAELFRIDSYEASVESKKRFPGFADADVLATKTDRVLGEIRLLVQIKHHSGSSGPWGAEQLSKIIELEPDLFSEHKLVLVTSANASRDLKSICEEKDIELIVGSDLVDWIFESIHALSKEMKTKLGIIEVPQLLHQK